MAEHMKNQWLDIESDQSDEDIGYDSDAREESKIKRAPKRRKISENGAIGGLSDQDSEDDGDDDDDLSAHEEQEPSEALMSSRRQSHTKQHASKDLLPKNPPEDKPKEKKTQQQKALQKSKTGVVYLSRVPPFMKPSTVRSLLSPYGNINRIYLTPEDPNAHKRRVKSGGNKKHSFIDGWVEFLRKKDAKIVAETLNTTIIGGKKGGWYHDDVWNLKYLKGFKWHHLTEQISNENAERAARLRTEIAQTTRENKRFVANVERAKMLENMRKKRRKMGGEDGNVEGDLRVENPSLQTQTKSPTSGILSRQKKVENKTAMHDLEKGPTIQPDHVQSVLSKIF